MEGLKRIRLLRYLQRREFQGKYIVQSYRDESDKTTMARWKLVQILRAQSKDCDNYLYKLDKRSIRFMKRVTVLENKQRRRRNNGSTSKSDRPSTK